jgi:hypothetical protein
MGAVPSKNTSTWPTPTCYSTSLIAKRKKTLEGTITSTIIIEEIPNKDFNTALQDLIGDNNEEHFHSQEFHEGRREEAQAMRNYKKMRFMKENMLMMKRKL